LNSFSNHECSHPSFIDYWHRMWSFKHLKIKISWKSILVLLSSLILLFRSMLFN
jgi:hypothetical protein